MNSANAPEGLERFEPRADGLFARRRGGGDDDTWVRVSSPILVEGFSRGADGCDWGLVVRVADPDGVSHTIVVKREAVIGGGDDAMRQLAYHGFCIAPAEAARRDVLAYLMTAKSNDRVIVTERVGWLGDRFVLPDVCFGAESFGDRVLFAPASPTPHAFQTAGDLDGWRRTIGEWARGNSRLQFALSAAFAAPLLHLCGSESGGYHLMGASSTGKSTALVVAGSVWGGGEAGYVKQWRATDNALEATAVGHCDALLCLDEISQLSPGAAGSVAYMLANGKGKQRARRSGAPRQQIDWRTQFLSTGETLLEDKIAEGKGAVAAGMAVRFASIEADAGAGLGLFEDLHGAASARHFSDLLKRAGSENYGHAARQFLLHLTEGITAGREAANLHVARFIDRLELNAADPQVLRVAARMAIVAAGGELAAAFGVVPWTPGEASASVQTCFESWLRLRGGQQSSGELQEAVRRLKALIETHGASRFESWEPRGGAPIRERLGFFRDPDEGDRGERRFFFTTTGWNTEITHGMSKKAVNRQLIDAGVLVPDPASGRGSVAKRPPSAGGSMRLYEVNTAVLREI